MRIGALVVAVTLTGCSALTARKPASGWDASREPDCHRGKGAVAVDGTVAGVLTIGALGASTADSGSAGALMLVGALAYGISAGYGSSAANKCRAAIREHDDYLAASEALPDEVDEPRAPRAPAPELVAEPKPPRPAPQPAPDPYDEPATDDDWGAFWAEEEPSAVADSFVRGSVVKLEGTEIYVNLGEDAGIAAGARLRIKRPISITHPITRKAVTDWLPIGTAEVTFAGTHLSMATLGAELLAEIEAGDAVEIYVERPDAAPPPAPAPTPVPDEPATPVPVVDVDTQTVLAVWRAQRGATLDARIAAWEGYLSANAGSPYAEPVRADLVELRAMRDRLTPPSMVETRLVGGAAHDAPTLVASGVDVPLVFVLDDPDAVRSAWLHFRTAGQDTFQRVLLEREHGLYLRGAIPASAVAAPGVDYYLEVVDADGESGVAVAETRIEVERAGVLARFTPAHPRTRVSAVATLMDFATFDRRPGDHTDYLYQLEVDVTYGLDGPLAGLSTGLGILEGEGGRIDPLPGETMDRIGYQYGYVQADTRLSQRVGAAARLIAGIDRTELGLGVEGSVRIGDALGTNLTLTASQIARVGYLTDIRFQVDPDGRVPIGFSVGATDRPSRGDPAVRLGVDVELRTLRWLGPQLRLTYQGRNVEHSGLGAGLGLSFRW